MPNFRSFKVVFCKTWFSLVVPENRVAELGSAPRATYYVTLYSVNRLVEGRCTAPLGA